MANSKIIYFETCSEAPKGCLPVEWLDILRERWSPLPSCREPIDLLSEGDLWYPALWVDDTHTAFLGGEWRGDWESFKTLFWGGFRDDPLLSKMDEIVERVEKGQLDPQEGFSLLRKLAEEVDDDIFREALQGASLSDGDFKVSVVFTIEGDYGDLVLDSVGEEAKELLEEVKSLASSLE